MTLAAAGRRLCRGVGAASRRSNEFPLHPAGKPGVPEQVTSQTRPEGVGGPRRTWVYVEARRRPRTKYGEVKAASEDN